MRTVTLTGTAAELVTAAGTLYRHTYILRSAGLPYWAEDYQPAAADYPHDATPEGSPSPVSRWVLTSDDVVVESFGALLAHHDREEPGVTWIPGLPEGALPVQSAGFTAPVCVVCGTRRSRHHYLFAGGTSEHRDPVWVGGACLERQDSRFTSSALFNAFLSPSVLLQRARTDLPAFEHVPVGVVLAAVMWLQGANPHLPPADARFTVETELIRYAQHGTVRPEIGDVLLPAEVQRVQLVGVQPETVMERKLWDLAQHGPVPILGTVVGLFLQTPRVLQRAEARALAHELGFPSHDTPSREHVGTVGERFRDMDVLVVESRWLPDGGAIVVFQDTRGNKMTWFTDTHIPEKGAHGSLTATVKKHDWFQGNADTRVNRCAFNAH